jgi:hypothetical protein
LLPEFAARVKPRPAGASNGGITVDGRPCRRLPKDARQINRALSAAEIQALYAYAGP